MPVVEIKPSQRFAYFAVMAESELHPQNRLTRDLGMAMPLILAIAWPESLGNLSTGSVDADVLPPYNLRTEATPSLRITVKPSYTAERYAKRYELRAGLCIEVNAWLDRWMKTHEPLAVNYDLDVEFTWGCGAHIDDKRTLLSQWPE